MNFFGGTCLCLPNVYYDLSFMNIRNALVLNIKYILMEIVTFCIVERRKGLLTHYC